MIVGVIVEANLPCVSSCLRASKLAGMDRVRWTDNDGAKLGAAILQQSDFDARFAVLALPHIVERIGREYGSRLQRLKQQGAKRSRLFTHVKSQCQTQRFRHLLQLISNLGWKRSKRGAIQKFVHLHASGSAQLRGSDEFFDKLR